MIDLTEDAEVFPVKPGDWVAHRTNFRRFGIVKDVLIDRGEMLIHVVLYDENGTKIGRESPLCGGPRTFEPCCPYESWHRIDRPDFPVTLRWVDIGDGTRQARYYSGPALLDRKWIRPTPKLKVVPAAPNLNLGLEVAALLRAAQELRSAAKLSMPESKMVAIYRNFLIERAETLEKEAERLRVNL